MIAIFDLDKTLINEDSTTLWSQWLCNKGLVADVQAYLNQEKRLMQQYEARQLNIADYIKLTLQPIMHLTIQQVDLLVHDFIIEQIQPRVYQQSLALLKQHQQNGDEVLIISASAQILVAPIARYCFQVETSFGIEVEIDQQHYTDQVTGIIPYQAGKLAKFQQYTGLNQTWFEQVCFYSDSMNDEPLLRAVQYPHAINPDDKLLALATQLQWPIDFFQKTVSE